MNGSDIEEQIKEIGYKIDKIADAWKIYFLEYLACKKEINFTAEVRTNYVADIFIYLRDTLPFLKNTGSDRNSMNNVFNAFGVLQTLYVQQDLLDEILYVFKLQESNGDDKTTNRRLRNELIGHPVSRIPTGELRSSVFLGWGFPSSGIDYVRYDYKDGFLGKDVNHNWNDILSRHFALLHTQLNLVWKKIEKVLRPFCKDLIELQHLLHKAPFQRVLDMCLHRFEIIFSFNEAYDRAFLITCEEQLSSHPRFSHIKGLFLQELEACLSDSIRSLKRLLDQIDPKSLTEEIDIPEIRFEVVVRTAPLTQQEIEEYQRPQRMSYEFSKLYQDHPIFGIGYFMDKFGSDPIVKVELEKMKVSKGTPMFSCCYEYLKDYLEQNN